MRTSPSMPFARKYPSAFSTQVLTVSASLRHGISMVNSIAGGPPRIRQHSGSKTHATADGETLTVRERLITPRVRGVRGKLDRPERWPPRRGRAEAHSQRTMTTRTDTAGGLARPARAARSRGARARAVKAVLVRLHRYAGLGAALFLAAVGISGAMIAAEGTLLPPSFVAEHHPVAPGAQRAPIVPVLALLEAQRSEERRVGKEGRSGGGQEH